jgi:hypothetical protein
MKKILLVLGIGFFLLAYPLVSPVKAQGHFELGFHYGTWNINLLKGMIEEGLADALESDLKDQFLADIQEDHPTFQEKYYNQSVSFDSGGNSYGFEIRWYPGGENGSFSLGLGFEKTRMEIRVPKVSARLDVEDTTTSEVASFEGEANGSFLIEPFSLHLTFRWDILPSSFIHPYVTFGIGAAGRSALDEAQVEYNYQGILQVPGEPAESYEGGETKSLKEIMDEMEKEGEEFFLPGFFPFVQLNFGLKAKISPNFHALVDVGVFNGFLLRGGLALRL